MKIKFCLPSASIYLENASTAIAIYLFPFFVNGSGPSIKNFNFLYLNVINFREKKKTNIYSHHPSQKKDELIFQ